MTVEEKIESLKDAARSFRRADQRLNDLKRQVEDAKHTRERAYSIYEAEQEALKEMLDPLHHGPMADPNFKENE